MPKFIKKKLKSDSEPDSDNEKLMAKLKDSDIDF